MRISVYIISLLALLFTSFSHAQQKQAMTFEEMVAWQRITSSQISNDGKWVTCKMEPWKGDGTVFLYDNKGAEKGKYTPASKGEISGSSEYFIVTITPSMAVEDSLKLRKTDSKKMPMNSLIIRNVKGDESRIDSIRNYKLPEKENWIAYQRGTSTDSALYIMRLDGVRIDSIPMVTDYGFSRKRNNLYLISDSLLYTYSPLQGRKLISTQKGIFKTPTFDEKGTRLTYLFCQNKDSLSTNSSIYLSENNDTAKEIATKGNKAFPQDWIISDKASLSFSENGERLFFGTAPLPKEKDTTILAENFPNVQVWTWNEGVQYTQQNYNKTQELNRSYRAVYNIKANTIIQLGTKDLPDINIADRGNADIALLSTPKPYATESMWTGRYAQDIFTVNLNDGSKSPLFSKFDYRLMFSPEGKYLAWYADRDSSWYLYSIDNKQTRRLTTSQSFEAWDIDDDVPEYPSAYGLTGWTTDDEELLLKDRYDIWKFSTTQDEAPINITINGKEKKIQYNLLRLDPEERAFDLTKKQYLLGFNELTKGNGYYLLETAHNQIPTSLIAGDFKVSSLKKAKDTDAVIYTKETYEEYPDIRLSSLDFKKSIQLTHGDNQQNNIIWGKAELTSWISLDGRPLEGIIYKPANFDPQKKYPMIVNFYERNANTLYNYHMPSPHRSTIDYAFYISQGYIIFNPDVRYTTGYPGESCYNCVMPGITSILNEGYVNEKAIGAQGHSWGGYQVAYLATRTNLFAAIESGAPVVNMLSAYGGIRWGSGMNRSFQYEHGQSRIGGSIWERPLQYIENSPLINMDKVTTPILIMHNDADGHVPWYQGIEYFVALRRLQKPAWLLNYVGEPHWPSTIANRIDFQKRMFQFFQHYLQGAPIPQWMEKGIPAVDKDYELGY